MRRSRSRKPLLLISRRSRHLAAIGLILLAFSAALLTMFVVSPQHAFAQVLSPEFDINEVTVPASPPMAAFGAGSYAENCAPCHGIEGMGDGPTAADLPNPPTAFADPQAVWERSPAELFHTTKFGRMTAMMPPWLNELSDEMIWHTVAYAWSLHTNEQETLQGADAYAVSCANCHGETGAGDGPDAEERLQDFSDPVYAMANSQADWLASWQEAHPEIGAEWTIAEQRQTLEYVRSFSQVPPWMTTAEGDGVIRGVVVPGTPGGAGLEDAVVTLESFVDFQPMAAYSTTVAADGSFEFTDLAVDPNSTDPSLVYLASVSDGGIRYSSPIISLTADQPIAETDVVVYDVTDDPSGIVLDRVHWIIDSQPGALVMIQVIEVGNTSDRTYVGASVEGSDTPVTVAFHVPENAVELSFENGALGERFQQVGDRIYDTTPVVPGSSTRQIVMQYALPYEGEQTSLTQAFEYPVSTVNLLVADQPGLNVDVPQLLSTGQPQDFNGRVYEIFRSTGQIEEPITVNLSGLMRAGTLDPRAVEASGGVSATTAATPYESWMPWLVGLLTTGALAGVVTWTWKQGRLESRITPDDLRAQRGEFLRRIARLDDLHALGEISDGSWQAQRAQLKNKLIEIDSQLQRSGRK